MLVENLTIYDSWDIYQPSIPSRSCLFPLEPIGIGTPQVESLTSYLIRLAESHCLSLPILISRLISSHLQNTFPQKGSSRNLGALFEKARALQGHGNMAKDFIQALEALTLRNDLSFLTLSIWSNVLLSKGLLRNNKAWCPVCYQQWWKSNKLLYEPLLWSLKAVKVCPQHHFPLWEKCPHCGSQLPLLTWKSALGCCSNCHQLLFSIIDTNLNNIYQLYFPSDELSKNIAISMALGELVEIMPKMCYLPNQNIIYDNIIIAINTVTQGDISAFANFLKLPKNTVWGWYHRKSFPPIDSLLAITQCLDISLLIFLTKKINSFQLAEISAVKPFKSQKSVRKSPRKLDLNFLEQQLLTVLNQSDDNIPSLKQVAENLGYDRRVLSRRFPELCHAISIKHRLARTDCHYQTIKKCCEDVRTVTYSLYAEGQYPSEARVAALISKPSFFRYEQVRSSFEQVRRELGFEP